MQSRTFLTSADCMCRGAPENCSCNNCSGEHGAPLCTSVPSIQFPYSLLMLQARKGGSRGCEGPFRRCWGPPSTSQLLLPHQHGAAQPAWPCSRPSHFFIYCSVKCCRTD